jgi:hypothetical protein
VRERSARRRALRGNTKHSDAPSRIRTRNPSKRAVANVRLRPRGHWNRHKPRRPVGGADAQLCSFFNLDARWGRVVNATPRPLYPRERPGTHCILAGWVLGSVWTDAENLAPTGIPSPDRQDTAFCSTFAPRRDQVVIGFRRVRNSAKSDY